MRSRVLLSIFVLLFCFGAAYAQKTENKLAAADQRLIIGILLNEKFKNSPEKIIYLSTANIPEEIRKNFPPVKDKTIRLISAETAGESETCAYEFGEFQVIDKFVSVTFGSCREGLAYDFIKDGDRWKSVASTITRELFY
jgi:5,10-methylenetetrahydrofolate reductase